MTDSWSFNGQRASGAVRVEEASIVFEKGVAPDGVSGLDYGEKRDVREV